MLMFVLSLWRYCQIFAQEDEFSQCLISGSASDAVRGWILYQLEAVQLSGKGKHKK